MIKLFKYQNTLDAYIRSEMASIGLFTQEETISFLIRPAPRNIASLLRHKSRVWQAGKRLYRHEVSLDSLLAYFGSKVRWQGLEQGVVVVDSLNLVEMREYISKSKVNMRDEVIKMKEEGMDSFDINCFTSFEYTLPHVRIFVGDKSLKVNKVSIFTPV